MIQVNLTRQKIHHYTLSRVSPVTSVTIARKQLEVKLSRMSVNVHQSGVAESVKVAGEVPMGLVDGSNPLFLSLSDFVPESVEVYLNGILQTLLGDYVTSGNRSIILYIAPTAGEIIRVNYTVNQ